MGRNKWWPYKGQGKLALRAGLSKQYLTDILHHRRRCSVEMAVRLAKACAELNLPIEWQDWVAPELTKHPAFFRL
jgi:hypothetical protein